MRLVKPFAALALGAGLLFATVRLGAAPVALKTSEFGSGPAVVLVHGLGGNGFVWMPTVRRLLASHRVVMVDLPGHGESPLPDPFSLDDVAQSLDAVLAKQPGGAVVVGHGMGGLIALQALRRHPEHVKGLVLIDANAKSPISVPDQQQRRFMDFIDQNYDMFLRGMFTAMVRDSAQGVEIHALASQVPKRSITSYVRALFNADESAALRAPQVPVLYVGSARTWPDTTSWASVARSRGFPEPGVLTARRIGNCGSWVMRDQPDSLAAVLSEFTKSVGPVASDR